jgi:hypothetical protein
MTINGTYKISIEMTARKQVSGLLRTARRLLDQAGDELPAPPDTEEHIQAVIDNLKANQEVFDSFEMTISDTTITVRTSEGVLTYEIQRKTVKDENHVALDLESEEMGTLTWDVTHSANAFLIDSVDGLSEYAFERK